MFPDFASFRLINHITPAKHRRQLTYQEPSFQWLKDLLLRVEKMRLKVEFCLGVFAKELLRVF